MGSNRCSSSYSAMCPGPSGPTGVCVGGMLLEASGRGLSLSFKPFRNPGEAHQGSLLSSLQIEEGGKADSPSSRLRAGDEVVHINEVALSSSRREAVSLVKGSFKTLRLVVRR